MTLWRQLRWRIFAAQMVIVLVGVAIVLILVYIATRSLLPADLENYFSVLISTDIAPRTSDRLLQQINGLFESFRRSVFTAVLIAAGSAIIAGIISSLLLMREIIRPLEQIARSSKRIADGHYEERVTVPPSDELGLVATNFNQMAEALALVEDRRIALIGDISHELRTPLTGLAGYLEGMMDGLFPIDDQTLVLMNQEVGRMSRLVNDLQTLSRVEAGQFSLNLTTVNVRGLIDRTVANLQPQWQTQSFYVEVISANNNIFVQADADRLAQILQNLLRNAFSYTPDGGEIRVEIRTSGRTVQIAVKDTGIGIDQEKLPFIFERFYRVDGSRARVSGGSGIGLTISRHLAWAMGGDLSVASDGLGKGSTFTLELPLAPI